MTSIFTSERQALQHRVCHNRKVIYGLAGSAIACLLAPILFDSVIPRPIKTGLLGTATAGLLGAAIISQQTQVGEDMMQSLRTADKEHLKRHFAHKAAVAEQEQMIASRADLLKRILYSQQPIRWQWEAAKQCGIENDWKAVALEWGWVPYHILYPPQQQRSPSTQPQAAMVHQQEHEALPMAYQEQLPVLDIPSAIAGYDGHLLVASRTGSGKSTLIQGAIAATHQRHDGMVDFHVFDPKGASWLGLERDSDYLFCNKSNKIPELLSRLTTLEQVLESRQEQRIEQGGHWTDPPMPIVVILDEFNTLRSLCRVKQEKDDNGKNVKFDEKAELCRIVERIIFQGREDRVYLWLMAQSTRVTQLGLDTSVQDNLTYIALARNGDYQSVEDAIGNNYVIGNSQERSQLWELLGIDKQSSRDKRHPIAFTTLSGNQLCLLPDLSQAKNIRLQLRTMNQSGLDGWKAQLEAQFKLDFKPDFEPQSEPIDGDIVDDEPSGKLPETLRKLLEFSQGREWIKPRDVQSGCKPLRGFSTVQILDFFKQLADLGAGEVRGADPKLEFRAYG